MKSLLRITLLALLGLMFFKPASAQVVISVGFAPPALPVYEQPVCPEDGFMWTPGYWAWDDDDEDYYWVPGTWVAAPEPGYLWTPAWWGWENGAFIFHDGYWGTEIGFYGGVNYGFGYFGRGFYGGRWDHDHFYYNSAVVNVNTTVVRNVYVDKTVINNTTIINNNRVSYNGGEGGITARPTPQEEHVAQERHLPPVQAQMQHRQMAQSNPQMRASANQGKPPIAATARSNEFGGRSVVAAKSAGAPYHPPANRPAPRNQNARPGNESAQPGNGSARPGSEDSRKGNETGRPGTAITRPGETPRNENARPAEPPRTVRPAEPPRSETERPAEPPRSAEPAPKPAPNHAREVQPHEVTPAPKSGNTKADENYQKQQQKLAEEQNKEHEKLQAQQEKEDQTAQRNRANEQKQQQLEQRHAQQTQQMEQKHTQQQQKMQERAPASKPAERPAPPPKERKPQ